MYKQIVGGEMLGIIRGGGSLTRTCSARLQCTFIEFIDQLLFFTNVINVRTPDYYSNRVSNAFYTRWCKL